MRVCQNVETLQQHEAVGEEADDEGAEQHPAHVSATSGQRRAADDHRRDRVELECHAGVRARRWRARSL